MILASPGGCQRRQPPTPRWQRELAEAIATPEALVRALGLDLALAPPARAASRTFKLRVPWSYVRRMRRGDPRDPLLLQVLPVAEELAEQPGFVGDPLGEHAAIAAPALLQKYRGRALLIATPACAVHCRYCFRREFPYEEHTDGPRWRDALAHLEQDAAIEEVILSGGDPLSLTDARLAALSGALEPIAHVRRLRLHTRLPIVLPSRVDAGFTRWLSSLKWPVAIVLHANHPNEIDSEVRTACAALRSAGATLLNQSVLLAGVNDDVGTLATLARRLFEAGVLPYYLHLLDRVRGAAHFEVEESRARRIAGELAATLPGYLVPRLVREQAGAPAKVPICPELPGQSAPS